jgi:hypothetical protein
MLAIIAVAISINGLIHFIKRRKLVRVA